MTHEDSIRADMVRFLELHREQVRAEEEYRKASAKADSFREQVQEQVRKLSECVGPNIRTRNAVIDGSLVRVQFSGHEADGKRVRATVTVEDLVIGSGAK